MGDPRLEDDPAHAYAWLMTNYWETNFGADLGGFHEFRFTVESRRGAREPRQWGDELRAMSREPVVVRLLDQ
jgi:hypothetical protein